MAKKKIDFVLSAVNNTKRQFDNVTSGLGKMAGVAGTATKGVAAVGLAAVGTATAIAILVDKSFQVVDAIGKTATQTGIATDTLQAFHLAARESGTSVEGANTALIKFARTIGDADKGLKTQADIFKDLGVVLRDTSGVMRSFDDILIDTADGINQLGSQSERASALAGLFGRQGVILTGAIKDLSERGLVKFIQRAKDLGIVLNKQVIRRTEEFNDAVGVLKMQIGAFVNNITTSLLPVFEKLQTVISKKIEEIIKSAGGMDKLGAKIAKNIIEFTAVGIVAMGNFADKIADMVNIGEVKIKELGIAFAEFQINLLKMSPFQDFTKEIEGLEETISTTKDEILVIGMRTSDFGKKANVTAEKLRAYKGVIDELVSGTKSLTGTTEEAGKKIVDIGSPLAVFIDSIENGVGKTIETSTVGAMKKFESTIVDGIKKGKIEFSSFADFVIEEMLRIAVQQMILKPITGAFTNFFGNFGDLFSADGGGFTGSGNRAGGVDNKGGFPAILHPNETVIDHTKGQSMGGGSATVNFNISTVDAAGFDKLLSSRKGLLTSIINNAMNTQGKMGVI